MTQPLILAQQLLVLRAQGEYVPHVINGVANGRQGRAQSFVKWRQSIGQRGARAFTHQRRGPAQQDKPQRDHDQQRQRQSGDRLARLYGKTDHVRSFDAAQV